MWRSKVIFACVSAPRQRGCVNIHRHNHQKSPYSWEVDRQIFTLPRYGEVNRKICQSYFRRADMPSPLLSLCYIHIYICMSNKYFKFSLTDFLTSHLDIITQGPALPYGLFRDTWVKRSIVIFNQYYLYYTYWTIKINIKATVTQNQPEGQ